MERESRVTGVDAYRTKSGSTRYVLRDEDRNEYTTFKEALARRAVAAEGKPARIRYHEAQRGEHRNVYLDDVEPVEDEEPAEVVGHGDGDFAVEETAWNAAVEAAPWLLGERGPTDPIPARELFERLKPFQEEVADDIRDGDEP